MTYTIGKGGIFMFERNEDYFEPQYAATSLQKHAVRTFGWMTLGLLVTTATAFAVYSTDLIYYIYTMRFAPLILIAAQFGVVIALGPRLMQMSATSAKLLFLAYSMLTGITFSTLALVYLPGTLAMAFLMTTVYFGSLAVIGYTTKMNLLRFGPILFGSLLALIITEVIMMFMGADTSTMLMSAIGLLIFTGLTAYDAQKMKALYASYEGDEEMLKKLSIYSAFELYLDFINIFLYILRFVGNRD